MTTLLLDDFNRADAGALGDPSAGPSPTYQSGSWEIASNQAKPDNSGTETLVWWDIGATSYVLEATLATKAHTSGTLLNAILFRGDGGSETAGHFWMAQANGASASWDTYYRNAGSGWTGPMGTGPTVADGQKVTVYVTPTKIRVYFDNALYITLTDSTFGTNTQVGLRGYTDTVRWDDISAYSLYSDRILSLSPVAYWEADEASGNLADATGNGRTMVANGSPTYSRASLVLGGAAAIYPDAGGDFFSVADATLAQLNSAWSVEAWVKPQAGSQPEAGILTSGYDGSKVPWALGTNGTSNEVFAGFYNGSWRRANSTFSLSSGSVYHLVGTWDGTDIKLYVNGVLDTTTTPGSSPGSSTHTDVYLGRRWDTSNRFDGHIDEPAVYNYALTATQVADNYAVGTGGDPSVGAGRLHLPQEYAVRQANQVAIHRAQR